MVQDQGNKTRYRYGSLDNPTMCYRSEMTLRPTPVPYINKSPESGLSLMSVRNTQSVTQAVSVGGHLFLNDYL